MRVALFLPCYVDAFFPEVGIERALRRHAEGRCKSARLEPQPDGRRQQLGWRDGQDDRRTDFWRNPVCGGAQTGVQSALILVAIVGRLSRAPIPGDRFETRRRRR